MKTAIMSKYICKDCGTGFAVRPLRDCPCCGSDSIVSEADSVTERHTEAQDEDYINKMVRHLLNDLIEKTYSGPSTEEFWDSAIEQTMARLRPYLRACD